MTHHVTAIEESLAPAALGDHSPSRAPSLTSLVIRSGIWVSAGKVASRGLELLRYVVLGRLLAPEDIGLFGIITLTLAAMETLTETGFQAALIQRRAQAETYLDTAWTVQVVRGFLLGGILYVTAPLFAVFFDEPRLVSPLQALSVVEVARGLTNIGVIYFQKELEFRKQVTYEFTSSAIALVAGIVLAWQLRNVWALVWAQIAGQLTKTALSYCIHPYRPRARFNHSQAVELFTFGRWVFGSTLVFFVSTKVDQAVLGKVLGVGALGIYAIARQIADLPATEISSLTRSIMMPAYARLQGNRQYMGRAFLQTFEVVMSLAIPLTTFLVVAAPQIILGLFGEQWEAAILPLRILALAGLLRATCATGGPLFLGAGNPHMDFWMNLGRAIIVTLTSYPLTRLFGISGTSAAIVLSLALTLPVWARVRRIAEIPWIALVRACAQGFLLAGTVVVAVVGVGFLVPDLGALALLILQGSAAVFLCTVAVLGSGHLFHQGLSIFALKVWRSLRTV